MEKGKGVKMSKKKKYDNQKSSKRPPRKTSAAQIRASRNWEKRNPERALYIRYRNNARTFARHHATEEDTDELIQIFHEENPNSGKQEKGE